MAQPQSTRLYLPYLEGIRALAALYVLLHHLYLPARPYMPPWLLGATAWLAYGHLAVNVFIVLSGYCLALPVVQAGGTLRGGAAGFFQRRAWRILPTYYAALGVSLALAWLTARLYQTPLGLTPFGVVSRLLLFQDVLSSTIWQVNVPLWSVAVEWRIYLVFPLLVGAIRRLGLGGALGLTTLLSLALTAALALLSHRWSTVNANLYYADVGIMPHYLALFGFGVGAAAWAHEPRFATLRTRFPALAGCLGLVALTVVAALLERRLGHPFPALVRDFGVGGATALLLLHLAGGEQGALRRGLSRKPLVTLGTFSYSLYLVHIPLLSLGFPSLRHLPQPLFFVGLLALGGLTVLGAYGFFLAFERPFLRRRQKP